MRVHELAKKYNITSKELIEKLKQLKIKVSSHMGGLTDEEVKKIEKMLSVPVKQPSGKQPSVKKPSVKQPSVKQPSVKEPSTKEPLAKQPLPKQPLPQKSLHPKPVSIEKKPVIEKPIHLIPRAPVVTIMGHVDHGKTLLLDKIRKSNVAAKEAGAITQHIGAYKVSLPAGEIVFLDTPGHEAFTTLRARGAKVTDIVGLVVAADDGVMPQTVEAINHAREANVPIIVIINKIDLPNADVEKVKNQLLNYNLVCEEWGGDTIFVETSAKTGVGIDELLEMIILLGEMLELKADPTGFANGVVLEAKLDKFRGPLGTVLIQSGELKTGDYFVCGKVYGKVKAMFDEYGRRLDKVGPSTPVEIMGFEELPRAGDIFLKVENEQKARQISNEQKEKEKNLLREKEKPKVSLDTLYNEIQEEQIKELKIILKTDTQGSLEALDTSLIKLNSDKIKINVIHKGLGGITETDVLLASASKALIIGFNVRYDSKVEKFAQREGVEIKTYNIIYDAIDEIKKAIEGVIGPQEKEVIEGRLLVKEVFKISGVGNIAGCIVKEGEISASSRVRVIRNDVVVYDGKVSSLKRYKQDIEKVGAGYECGVAIEKFNDLKPQDIIESYRIEKSAFVL